MRHLLELKTRPRFRPVSSSLWTSKNICSLSSSCLWLLRFPSIMRFQMRFSSFSTISSAFSPLFLRFLVKFSYFSAICKRIFHIFCDLQVRFPSFSAISSAFFFQPSWATFSRTSTQSRWCQNFALCLVRTRPWSYTSSKTSSSWSKFFTIIISRPVPLISECEWSFRLTGLLIK